MPKYMEIAALLKQRMGNGEYASGKMPPLRKLAEEMGVSYLTARQAVKYLAESGDVALDGTGRMMALNGAAAVQRPLVALITPYWSFSIWQLAIRNETLALGGQIRIMAYGSDTDPVITEALSGDFDLFFIVLPAGANSRLMERLAKLGKKVVVLHHDCTADGMRSLMGAGADAAIQLLEMVAARGHRKIDAISARWDQVRGFEDRIDVWQAFLAERGLAGTCHEMETAPFERDDEAAYRFCRTWLNKAELADAYFCMTPQVAFGFYRACFDLGIEIGRDVSVFSFGDKALSSLMTPPLATVAEKNVTETIRRIIQEYRPGGKRSARLCFQVDQVELIEGKSLKHKEV